MKIAVNLHVGDYFIFAPAGKRVFKVVDKESRYSRFLQVTSLNNNDKGLIMLVHHETPVKRIIITE